MLDFKTDLHMTLNDLIQRCAAWEDGVYKQANTELYAILEQCAKVFTDCRDDKKTARSFNAVAEILGVKFNKGTSMALKVVRVVFGQQNHREFAYARVLKLWHEEAREGQTLTNYVIEKGGIENVRRNEGKRTAPVLTNDDYREIAANTMSGTPVLASFPVAEHMLRDEENDTDYIVALVHCDANGTGKVIYGSNRRSLVDAALAVMGKEINELQEEHGDTDLLDAKRQQTAINIKTFFAKQAAQAHAA
jgi:hypothetical protein